MNPNNNFDFILFIALETYNYESLFFMNADLVHLPASHAATKPSRASSK